MLIYIGARSAVNRTISRFGSSQWPSLSSKSRQQYIKVKRLEVMCESWSCIMVSFHSRIDICCIKKYTDWTNWHMRSLENENVIHLNCFMKLSRLWKGTHLAKIFQIALVLQNFNCDIYRSSQVNPTKWKLHWAVSTDSCMRTQRRHMENFVML